MAREWQELQRPLRLGGYGFWPNFDPTTSSLVGLLHSQVNVDFVHVSDAPDVVLCSVFGECNPKGGKPDALKDTFTMQFWGEAFQNYDRRQQYGDYQLGFLPDDSEHFHLPLWMLYAMSFDSATRRLTYTDSLRTPVTKDRFCAIYASHDKRGDRGRFVDELNKYQQVDCYGAWKNKHVNDSKMAGLDRYKYSLAFESCQEPFYVTEKLWEATMSNTMPIYWGAPNLHETEWNPKRIIDATRASPSDVRQAVMTLDREPARYADMLRQPVFSRAVFPEGGLAARSDILLKRILQEKA